MATSKYNLDINKQAIIKPLVILRQGDYGIDTMHVSLAVANEPMDLTGATIKFMGTTANGSKIIDNEHVKIIDAHGGVFEYVFPSEAASDIGEYKVAYFSIVQANGQSSTMDFRVQVLSGVDITASEANGYVSQYDTLVTKLNSAYDSATKATNQKMASTVSSLATSAATVLDSALARVNNVNSTANSASSAASKAVSMASSVASTVTSQASYINSVASSATSNVSSVASSATSNVSSVAAGVVDKLNSISVGGRNYILNSSGLDSSDSIRPVLKGSSTYVNVPVVYSSSGIKLVNNVGSAQFYYQFASAFTNLDMTPLVAGNTYTLSLKVRGTAKQAVLRVGYQNIATVDSYNNINPDAAKWTKATITFTIPDNAKDIFIRMNAGVNGSLTGFTGNETLELKEVMLEQSNIASDWVPAPEDAPSNDSQLVHKTGNEVIAGDKTFTSPINGQLVTEPENLFFNSEFENDGEGWQINAGGGSFSIIPGTNNVSGHTAVTLKLTTGYLKFGNSKLYPVRGNVNYSLSSLVNAGNVAAVYFIVDEFDGNKTQIKSTPYALTSVAYWGLKTASFVTQEQTQFVRVSYQVGGSSGQLAYIAAPMWNTGTTPLPYVRGSEMQSLPDNLVSNSIPVNVTKTTTSKMWFGSTLTATRTGNVVTIVNNKSDTGTITDTTISAEAIPVGYRPSVMLSYPLVYGSSLKGELQITTDGKFLALGAINGQYRLTATYITNDAWSV